MTEPIRTNLSANANASIKYGPIQLMYSNPTNQSRLNNNFPFEKTQQEIIDDTLSIYDMLEKQEKVITALLYAPDIFVNYIHYRGPKTLNLRITIPLIPYNDDSICCLLDKISKSQNVNIDKTCSGLNVKPLGPKGKVGIPYIITSDKEIKNHVFNGMIVKFSKIDGLHSKYLTSPPTSISQLMGHQLGIINCITDIDIKNIRYIASDEFTNETLIAYALNYLSSQYLLPPLFVKHYQGAVCTNSTINKITGLNIMENCNLGSLDKIADNPLFQIYTSNQIVDDNGREIITPIIDQNIMSQILIQITIGLNMLQSYVDFISADLKAGNIFVKSDPINIEYLGIKLEAPFTCKIADYGKSSCMLYKLDGTALRFYNENTFANIYLTIHPFKPEIETSDSEYFYTINQPFTSQLYTRTRHMGIPFYHSFDYYTVLVSILTNPVFYYTFFSNEKLRSIFWDTIWINDNLNERDDIEAMNRIYKYVLEGKGQKLRDAISILKGLKLRCNAVQLVINQYIRLNNI